MHRQTRWACSLLLLLPAALAACTPPPPAPPAPIVPVQPGPVPLAPVDVSFATGTAQSIAFARQISEIAAERSRRAGIRTFAQSVVDTETTSAANLAGIVGPRGTTLPDTLTDAQQRTVARLQQAAPGRRLARAYFSALVRSQIGALQSMQAYAASGNDPALRDFAARQVPIIQQQLAAARRVPRERGGG